jgi:2-polyprenyl-3-methyl-5-hydroxy-6-metoxy-1,4-benzoquinol methylase
MTANDEPHADPCFLCGGAQHARYDLGSHRLLYCARCQLGQLAPLPSNAELQALYGSESYFSAGGDGGDADVGGNRVGYADYAADAPQHARSFRARLEWLLRAGPVDELLEIGCGPGLFLAEARRLGVRHVVGVDPNPWAVEQARARGVDAHVGSVETIAADRRFDAIAMLDVLEHVVAPLPFLADVRARLHPDGRVLIMTPNIRSLLARVSGRRWVSLKVPEHVRYYSARSVRALLGAAGFDVVALRPAGQYVTVAFFLARLERLLPRATRVLRRVADGLTLAERVIFLTNGSIDVIARPSKAAP